MKKTILMLITIMMVLSMTACTQTPERDRDDDKGESEGTSWSEALFAESETEADEETATTDAPKEEAVPVETVSPAQAFAKERGLTLPDMEAEFITDINEVMNIVTTQEVWRMETNDEEDEFGDLFLEWFAQDGGYKQYNDFFGDLYTGGVWYIEGEKLVTETMDGTLASAYPVYAKTEDEELLYLYYSEFPAKYYTATAEEKNSIKMDSELVGNIRYYLCSASWELRGKYDEDGNFKELSPTRVYTFLADGQMVLREEGKYIKGRYTLNSDWLSYSLENGERYANTYYTDDTTGISYIFLYPDENSNASDVYWAVSRRNVSSIVEEGDAIQKRRDMPYWTMTISGQETNSYDLYDNLEMKSIDCTTYTSELIEFTAPVAGYSFDDLFDYLNVENYEEITIVYGEGTEKVIQASEINNEGNMLVVAIGNDFLSTPSATVNYVMPYGQIDEVVLK